MYKVIIRKFFKDRSHYEYIFSRFREADAKKLFDKEVRINSSAAKRLKMVLEVVLEHKGETLNYFTTEVKRVKQEVVDISIKL